MCACVCLTHGLHIQNGRLYELRAQVIDDESRDAERNTILSERSYNEHPLQLIAFFLPFSCAESERMEKQNKEADCGIQVRERGKRNEEGN